MGFCLSLLVINPPVANTNDNMEAMVNKNMVENVESFNNELVLLPLAVLILWRNLECNDDRVNIIEMIAKIPILMVANQLKGFCLMSMLPSAVESV